MAVGIYFSPPTLDEATYNAVREKIEASGPWPAVGMVHHSCFTEGPSRLAVFEIWESEQAMQAFGDERLKPAMQEVGFDPGEPAIVKIINVVQA